MSSKRKFAKFVSILPGCKRCYKQSQSPIHVFYSVCLGRCCWILKMSTTPPQKRQQKISAYPECPCMIRCSCEAANCGETMTPKRCGGASTRARRCAQFSRPFPAGEHAQTQASQPSNIDQAHAKAPVARWLQEASTSECLQNKKQRHLSNVERRKPQFLCPHLQQARHEEHS